MIAYEEEVFNKAVEILREKGYIYTRNEMKSVYDTTARYIKEKLREHPYLSVRLKGLGTAYLPVAYCGKQKRKHKNYKLGDPERAKKRYELWKERHETIQEHYENHQPTKTAKEHYMFYHVIKPYNTISSIRGYKMDDIEEIQNNL